MGAPSGSAGEISGSRNSADSSRAPAENRRSAEWTILKLLRWTTQYFEGQGIASARLDAECLLADALECDRLRLYVDYDKPLLAEERKRFREQVRRRAPTCWGPGSSGPFPSRCRRTYSCRGQRRKRW